jgi:phosphomannomutase
MPTGLLLALDMVMTAGKNLGEYLQDLEKQYGAFYPDRDGIRVSLQGDELLRALASLGKYGVGSFVKVGGEEKIIQEVIDIDGRKMIFEDGSWVMIRPSGTEPKVRFYVESRTPAGTLNLVDSAKAMLAGVGLL